MGKRLVDDLGFRPNRMGNLPGYLVQDYYLLGLPGGCQHFVDRWPQEDQLRKDTEMVDVAFCGSLGLELVHIVATRANKTKY